MLSEELKRALERESTGYVTPGTVYGENTDIEAMQNDQNILTQEYTKLHNTFEDYLKSEQRTQLKSL